MAASDLGGIRGRTIHFHTGTGEVLLHRLARLETAPKSPDVVIHAEAAMNDRRGGYEQTSKIRVLIVDDSAVVRQTLSEVLSSDPDIEVIGTASDPFVAAERFSEQVPDVITLDIEMPRMDGLTFLQKIMSQHPIPVVICSSLAEEGAQSTLQALEYGAVEIITKPRLGSKQFLEESRITLCEAVKAAAAARLRALGAQPRPWNPS